MHDLMDWFWNFMGRLFPALVLGFGAWSVMGYNLGWGHQGKLGIYIFFALLYHAERQEAAKKLDLLERKLLLEIREANKNKNNKRER